MQSGISSSLVHASHGHPPLVRTKESLLGMLFNCDPEGYGILCSVVKIKIF